jgi:AraC-like DNA-binding protein
MSGLIPVRQLLDGDGIDWRRCLEGTRIAPADFDRDGLTVTLRQEERLFANLLALTGDPALGLRLGRQYSPQRYGLFGYAMLSAPTLRHALVIATRFGEDLTFTWLRLGLDIGGRDVVFSLGDRDPLQGAVRDFFYDRDTLAVKVALDELLGEPAPISRVVLPHDGHGLVSRYRGAFGCPVEFNGALGSSLTFPTRLLERNLPFRDAATSERLQAQCQALLARFRQRGDLSSEVRELIVGQPGYFPGIEVVAKRLSVSVRTLRQRLADEGTGYQKILDQVRHGLASEYLENTRLPVQEIARLVGFDEPGNFTHAFKRWAGLTPSDYRLAHAPRQVP